MQDVIDHDSYQRSLLLELYRESEMYLGSLPLQRRRELESNIPNWQQRLEQNIQNLQHSDCAILIAG